VLARHPAQQQLTRGAAGLVGRVAHRGEGRADQRRCLDVVEADQPDVARDGAALLPGRVHGADGHEVVGAEDGRRVRGEREQLLHRRVPALTGPVAVHDQLRTEGDAGRRERVAVSLAAAARVVRALDHGDPVGAVGQQVGRGLPGAGDVVGPDAVDLRVLHVGAHADERSAEFGHCDDGLGGHVHRGHDDAVDTPVEHVLHEPLLPGDVAVGVADEGSVVGAGEGVGEPAGQHAVEGVGDVGDDDRDHLRLAGAQVAGDIVRPVAERLDDLEDPFTGGRTDHALAGEDVGHGRGTDAGEGRHLGDGDPAVAHPRRGVRNSGAVLSHCPQPFPTAFPERAVSPRLGGGVTLDTPAGGSVRYTGSPGQIDFLSVFTRP
jgi:hypothetical protein